MAQILPFTRRYEWHEYHGMLQLYEDLKSKGFSEVALSCILESAKLIETKLLRQERKDRLKARRAKEREKGPFAK